MFNHFAHDAREAVAGAREVAEQLGHGYIGTEHILLGLLRAEDTPAARVLTDFGVSFDALRVTVVRLVGTGEADAGDSVPLTPRAKRVLERSVREADALDSTWVGSEHVLLALAAETEGIAARLLLDFNASLEALRSAVGRLPVLHRSTGVEQVEPNPSADELLSELDDRSPDGRVDFGWRGHAVALAALGAARLATTAFGSTHTAGLGPLGIQVLVHLALAVPGEAQNQGANAGSLHVALACRPDDLEDHIGVLAECGLLTHHIDHDDEEYLALTRAGAAVVDEWLRQITPLFSGWPPADPGVDDAIG